MKENIKAPASLAFARGIHQWPVDSTHKGPVTRKMFPFDDVIMRMLSSSRFRQLSHRKPHWASFKMATVNFTTPHVTPARAEHGGTTVTTTRRRSKQRSVWTETKYLCPIRMTGILISCSAFGFIVTSLLNSSWVVGEGEYQLQWRHNGCDGISNHQHRHCLLNRLFRRRSKTTSTLHVTGLCAGNSPVTGELAAKMASYAENVSIWWRHHDWVFFFHKSFQCLSIENSALVLWWLGIE